MCGCNGKHTANPQHLEVANRDRGYEYDASEISERRVSNVLKQMKSLAAAGEPVDMTTTYACIETETLVLAIYFVPEAA